MNTILLIILFIVLGFVFGFIFARMIYSLSNYFLRRKVTKDALNNPKQFFFKQQPYDLKKEIEYERSKRKKFNLFSIFKKKVKGGINDYGDTKGIKRGTGEESVFGSPTSPTTAEPSPTSPATTREQEYTTPANPRGEQGRSFNRNLFEKGK